MRVINKTGASFVEHPPNSGNIFEPGPDGVFELPDPVAHELTKKHASHWVPEAAQAGTHRRDRAAKLRNPRVAADTISRLEARVETLEAQVAAMLAFVDEPEPEFEGEDDGGSGEEPESGEAASETSEDSGESSETESEPEAEQESGSTRTTRRSGSTRSRAPKGK